MTALTILCTNTFSLQGFNWCIPQMLAIKAVFLTDLHQTASVKNRKKRCFMLCLWVTSPNTLIGLKLDLRSLLRFICVLLRYLPVMSCIENVGMILTRQLVQQSSSSHHNHLHLLSRTMSASRLCSCADRRWNMILCIKCLSHHCLWVSHRQCLLDRLMTCPVCWHSFGCWLSHCHHRLPLTWWNGSHSSCTLPAHRLWA